MERLAGWLVDKMARIFVSSTFKDLEECRAKVRIVLRRMGHEDVAMEYFVAEVVGMTILKPSNLSKILQ